VVPSLPTDRVVIAVDPHKASWTAAVIDTALHPLDVVRVDVSADGYRQLRRFAQRWTEPVWAIEGAAGLGAPLTQRLAADDIEVIDVPLSWLPGCGCCRPGMAARPMKPTPSPSGSPQ